jgi:hypothetical protein
MRTKSFFFIVMTLLPISLGFSTLPVASARAEDGSIISIQSVESKTATLLTVNPAELTINKNTIVIWLNAFRDHDVNIGFAEGKTTEKATCDAMGFDTGKSGEYEAKYLPSIATASLRFVKEGTYSYTVESQPGGLAAKGKIIVR